MPKYEVRLQSQTDEQSRLVTLSAPDEDAAARACVRKEKEYAAFSILPPEPIEPAEPADDATHVEIDVYNRTVGDYAADMASYPRRLADAQARLDALSEALRFGPTGKVQGGASKLDRAHFHLHHQTEPYQVVDVREVRPDITRLVRELAGIHQDPKEWKRLLDALQANGTPIAAVTAFLYGVPLKNMFGGTSVWDWDTSTIKCSLHSSSYTPDQDTHDYFNDATNELSTANGYTAGGVTLTASAPTYDTASDQIRMDANDVSWTSSTITARYAVIWNDTAGASSTDPLIGYVDFGADVSTTNGTFQITWDTTGVVVFDVT